MSRCRILKFNFSSFPRFEPLWSKNCQTMESMEKGAWKGGKKRTNSSFSSKKKKKENPRIRRGKTKESGTGSRVHVHRTFGDFAGNIFRHWHAIRDYSYISKDRYKLFSLPAAYLCPLRPFKIPRAIQPRRDPGFWFSPFDVA